ncbi:hypothetical protein [Persicitalea jodogahamensis]|uniref:Uncharacterized protein n=1 Tax=Persicitalea jodogahamensis TaxID=402147 RepID=A0A8J3G8A1_9BACT|nr:hypothetical protein [Persicitalea jodogahamensis]GHB54393.1 hypothetical protein GCM10007390_04230 [Persicitalea jodogahamensis]
MSEQLLHIVTYTGPFGFIKPWTAVRDERTYSQQFLTPSIIEGLRIRLDVSAILRHKLTYAKIDSQQERTQSRAFAETRKKATREQSILVRGIMLYPKLTLAFATEAEAKASAEQHICLCRNEDILLPDSLVETISESGFDALIGFELIFKEDPMAILVGYDRYRNNEPMYGVLKITGNPVGSEPIE